MNAFDEDQIWIAAAWLIPALGCLVGAFFTVTEARYRKNRIASTAGWLIMAAAFFIGLAGVGNNLELILLIPGSILLCWDSVRHRKRDRKRVRPGSRLLR